MTTQPPSRLTPTRTSPSSPLKPHEISEGEKASASRRPQQRANTGHSIACLFPPTCFNLSLSLSSPLLPSRSARKARIPGGFSHSPSSIWALPASSPRLLPRWPPPASSKSSSAASFLPTCWLSGAAANGGRERGREGRPGGRAAGGRAPPRRVRSGLRVLVPRE